MGQIVCVRCGASVKTDAAHLDLSTKRHGFAVRGSMGSVVFPLSRQILCFEGKYAGLCFSINEAKVKLPEKDTVCDACIDRWRSNAAGSDITLRGPFNMAPVVGDQGEIHPLWPCAVIDKRVSDTDPTILLFGPSPEHLNTKDLVDRVVARCVFITDPSGCVFAEGLRRIRSVTTGKVTTPSQALDWIRETLTQMGMFRRGSREENLICVGASSGGYAALLAGYVLGARAVFACAPVSSLLASYPLLRKKRRKLPVTPLDAHMLTLDAVVARHLRPAQIHVYHCTGNAGDAAHAAEISRLTGAELHTFDTEGHMAAFSQLLATGELLRRIES